MRSLSTVIDEIIIAGVPTECAQRLMKLRQDSVFTAPELMYIRWTEAATILSDYSEQYADVELIQRIFGGQ